MQFAKLAAFVAIASAASAMASSHTIEVVNNCNSPTTLQLPGIGNFGAGKRTYNSDVKGGIAQACSDINGRGCTSVEFSLVDGISSADVTLIPPHVFDHAASFTLTSSNGNNGASCNNANCGPKNAFYKSDDYSAQRQVSGANASIRIQFC